MNLYEYNQVGYNSLPNLTKLEMRVGLEKIEDYINNHVGQYYALINNELKYYTMFHKNTFNVNWANLAANELLDIAFDLGGVKDYGVTGNGDAIAFWIDYNDEGMTHAFYFFKYDNGVIEV